MARVLVWLHRGCVVAVVIYADCWGYAVVDRALDHFRDSSVPFDLRELAELLSIWVSVQRTSPHFQRAMIDALVGEEELLNYIIPFISALFVPIG